MRRARHRTEPGQVPVEAFGAGLQIDHAHRVLRADRGRQEGPLAVRGHHDVVRAVRHVEGHARAGLELEQREPRDRRLVLPDLFLLDQRARRVRQDLRVHDAAFEIAGQALLSAGSVEDAHAVGAGGEHVVVVLRRLESHAVGRGVVERRVPEQRARGHIDRVQLTVLELPTYTTLRCFENASLEGELTGSDSIWPVSTQPTANPLSRANST